MFRAVLAFLGCVLLAGSVLAQGGFVGSGAIDAGGTRFAVAYNVGSGYIIYTPPDARNWLGGGDQPVTKVDLTDYTECRLVVNNQYLTPDPDLRLHLEYTTSFSAGSTPDGTWQNMASNDSCWVRVTTQNTIYDTGWMTLDASAIADDIFIAPVTDSGGATQIALGSVVVQFR